MMAQNACLEASLRPVPRDENRMLDGTKKIPHPEARSNGAWAVWSRE
jgi:hypothetical protein